MVTAARGMHALRVYLEMIKFEHSIFALPFAMLGMMWGARGWPGGWVFGWIVVAMVSARSAAMAFNRIADRDIDAENPRTKVRALPSGLLKLSDAMLFFYVSVGLFFLAAFMLNRLALILSPIAIGTTLFYSATKRFTPLCHLILGLSLGIAPAAAWIGATGSLGTPILAIVAAVTCWTAGFDIIYALQDEEFDRAHGLRSIPESLGKEKALLLSRVLHILAITLLALGGALYGAGLLYFIGVGVAGLLLAYEQSLVKPNDLSRVNLAFFTLNGFVSVAVFLFAWLDFVLNIRITL